MVEMLGVLAVMGVLTIVALLGYRYAIDKGKANRIFNDVELAYVSATSQGARENGVLQETEFEPSSGYPTYTELISDEEGSIDIVLVKNVPQSVCEIVLDMSQGTEWLISSVETDTNYLYRLSECADQNALVFSLFDVDDFVYGCEKDCPENMMCNVNDECVCAHGYEMNETTGECEEKSCDYALGLDQQTDRYCCEAVGGVWDNESEPSVCGCEEGYFFNGEECALDNWCSYTFDVPQIVQTVQSDCAYDFTVPEVVQTVQSDCAYDFTVPATVTADESEVTMVPVAGQTCSGGYCILNWTNEACTSVVCTYGVNTTKRIYGRCAPFDEYYDMCQSKTEGEVSMVPVDGQTCSSGYCILNWTNEACTSVVGTYGVNTTKRIYGRCAPFDEYYDMCQSKTEGEVSMRVSRPCQIENTYCSVLWGNQSCSGVGTYGVNTTRDLYGVCLEYDGAGDTACPFK